MKILIVYDSYFGNTQKIAETLADELMRTDEVKLVKAGTGIHIDTEGLDVIVVGTPTRAFSATPPIKEFLKQLSRKELKQVKLALFDTRVNAQKIDSKMLKFLMKGFGYGIDTMLKLVRSKEGVMACEPECFYVEDKEGPLASGEIKKAVAWAQAIKQGRV
jgi:flavodoxin